MLKFISDVLTVLVYISGIAVIILAVRQKINRKSVLVPIVGSFVAFSMWFNSYIYSGFNIFPLILFLALVAALVVSYIFEKRK